MTSPGPTALTTTAFDLSTITGAWLPSVKTTTASRLSGLLNITAGAVHEDFGTLKAGFFRDALRRVLLGPVHRPHRPRSRVDRPQRRLAGLGLVKGVELPPQKAGTAGGASGPNARRGQRERGLAVGVDPRPLTSPTATGPGTRGPLRLPSTGKKAVARGQSPGTLTFFTTRCPLNSSIRPGVTTPTVRPNTLSSAAVEHGCVQAGPPGSTEALEVRRGGCLTSTTRHFAPALASTQRFPSLTVAPPGWSADRLVSMDEAERPHSMGRAGGQGLGPGLGGRRVDQRDGALRAITDDVRRAPGEKPAAAEAPGKRPREIPLARGPRT